MKQPSTLSGHLASGPSVAHRLWLVFALALAVRLSYVLALYLAFGPHALLGPDSAMYVDLARGAAAGGTFMPPERMPLYILYLALHFAVTGTADPLFPALTQAGLDAATSVLVACIAGRFDGRLALPAGLFMALDPTPVVLGGTLFTDGLFLFLATAGLFAALRWLAAPGWRPAAALGLAFGLALSTRAMVAPWIPALLLFLAFAAFRCRRLSFRTFAQLALAGLLAAALQAPVLARNLEEYGNFQLTSQGGTHALLWIAPLVREAKDGTPHAQGAAELMKRFRASDPGAQSDNPFVVSRHMTRFALRELGTLGANAVAKAWLFGAAINLFSPAIILAPPVYDLPRTGFFETRGESKLAKIWNFLFRNDNPLYAWLLLAGTGGAVLLRFVQGYGFVVALGRTKALRFELAVLLGWLLYTLLIYGPIASAKYRLPIEPVLALFFAYAWMAFRTRSFRRARADRP